MTGMKTNERPGTKAQVRYLRMSPSKARVVLDLIRGHKVSEALEILQFSDRLAAEPIAKVLNSAVANAEHNDELAAEELYVSACYADEGPTLKRFRPSARGRAGRINKRTCHITVVVSQMSDEQLEIVRARSERSGAAQGDAAAARRRRVAASQKAAEPSESAEATDDAASAAATTEMVEGPYGPGSHGLVDGDPAVQPEGFPIKGNDDSKLYHTPDSPYYSRTVAEVWFADEAAAEAAGFAKPESQSDSDGAAADDAAGADGETEDASSEGDA